MRRALLLIVAIAFVAVPAAAVSRAGSSGQGLVQMAAAPLAKKPAAKPAPAKSAAKPVQYRCPFTGEKIANLKTAPKSVYKGKTYYFCCRACKTKFDKNPAAHVKQMAKPAPAAKNAPVVCPVMGGKVTNPKTAAKSVYKGKTYYFCCPGCKPEFEKNPEKYIKPKAAPKKH